jgi:hypothetical protein
MTHIDQLHPRIQWTDEKGFLTPFAFRWLTASWERLGGPDDAVEELQNGELYEVGVTDTKLTQVSNQLEELEFLIELQNKESQIQELEARIDDLEAQIDFQNNLLKRIEDIELELETFSIPNREVERRLSDLEIDTEMNYGA